MGGISVLPAGRSGWDCGVYAGAAEEETGKEVGDRLGKRPMIQVRNQGGQPGKGTGVSAGVENSSWAEREAGLWLRCVAGMGSVAGRGLGLEGVLLGGVWLG